MEFDEAVSKTTTKYLHQWWLAHEVSEVMKFDEFVNHMKSIGIEIIEDENVLG